MRRNYTAATDDSTFSIILGVWVPILSIKTVEDTLLSESSLPGPSLNPQMGVYGPK